MYQKHLILLPEDNYKKGLKIVFFTHFFLQSPVQKKV